MGWNRRLVYFRSFWFVLLCFGAVWFVFFSLALHCIVGRCGRRVATTKAAAAVVAMEDYYSITKEWKNGWLLTGLGARGSLDLYNTSTCSPYRPFIPSFIPSILWCSVAGFLPLPFPFPPLQWLYHCSTTALPPLQSGDSLLLCFSARLSQPELNVPARPGPA